MFTLRGANGWNRGKRGGREGGKIYDYKRTEMKTGRERERERERERTKKYMRKKEKRKK